ncbi:S8 family serine peptidase [Salipaludibacillus sp. CF4.18]
MTSKDIPNELITTDIGTSFAAPLVSNKAGMILKYFPTASGNLV